MSSRAAEWLAQDSHAVRASLPPDGAVLSMGIHGKHSASTRSAVVRTRDGMALRESPFRIRYTEFGSQRMHDLRCWEPPAWPGAWQPPLSYTCLKRPTTWPRLCARILQWRRQRVHRLASDGNLGVGLLATEAAALCLLAWNEASRALHRRARGAATRASGSPHAQSSNAGRGPTSGYNGDILRRPQHRSYPYRTQGCHSTRERSTRHP